MHLLLQAPRRALMSTSRIRMNESAGDRAGIDRVVRVPGLSLRFGVPE